MEKEIKRNYYLEQLIKREGNISYFRRFDFIFNLLLDF